MVLQNITVDEILTTLAAAAAFIPVMVCPGYLAGWLSDLHGFRTRSPIERLFWSIALSMAISPIACFLIGRFLSLNIVAALGMFCLLGSFGVIALEHRQLRRASQKWSIGMRPYGGTCAALTLMWVVICLLTLADIQRGNNLHSSLFTLDHSARISWAESVFRTGLPPENPLYFFHHPAPLRNYYFWYVICAVVMKISGVSAQAAMNASCIWAGFAVAALIGLYLKHFFQVGSNLRRQFIYAVLLLFVTGLDICANIFDALALHQPTRMDLEWWSVESVYSWYGSLFWVPHHVAGLVCCFFAFFLVCSVARPSPSRWVTVVLVGFSLASAFGLSLLVPFGFFLVMVLWAIWQFAYLREYRPVLTMAAGGVVAAILLTSYLHDVRNGPSSTASAPLFTIGVREMIPAANLAKKLASEHFFAGHPQLATASARLLLLIPSYILELGFYLLVLLVYLIPAWHDRRTLSLFHRNLVFICLAALPVISFVRSGFYASNDFGWRAAMILQFPLVLLASELLANWSSKSDPGAFLLGAHPVLRFALGTTLVIGVFSTISQALMLRLALPMIDMQLRADPATKNILAHNAYVSRQGYRQLDRLIAPGAIVQFPPLDQKDLWNRIDITNVDHTVAIVTNHPSCGSEGGGDPAGCPPMLAGILPIFNTGSASDAQAVCRQFGIQYLIAKPFTTPAWNDPKSWVWTLPPVLANPEFRALDCR